MRTNGIRQFWTRRRIDAVWKVLCLAFAYLLLYAGLSGEIALFTGVFGSIVVATFLLLVSGISYATILENCSRVLHDHI